EEDKKEHKRGGLFGLFGRKKDELVEERKNIDDTQNFIADIYNNKNGINYETANSTLNNTAKVEEPKLENNDKQNLAEPINTVAKESMAENTGTIAQEPNYKNFDEMYALTFGKPKKEEVKVEEENSEYTVS